jgi:hypothetical protein
VSSIAECVLGHSPTEALQVDVVDDLFTEFWTQEERHSHLEKSIARVYDMILRPCSGQV